MGLGEWKGEEGGRTDTHLGLIAHGKDDLCEPAAAEWGQYGRRHRGEGPYLGEARPT